MLKVTQNPLGYKMKTVYSPKLPYSEWLESSVNVGIPSLYQKSGSE